MDSLTMFEVLLTKIYQVLPNSNIEFNVKFVIHKQIRCLYKWVLLIINRVHYIHKLDKSVR